MSLRDVADDLLTRSARSTADATDAADSRSSGADDGAVDLDADQSMVDARDVTVSLGGVEVLSEATLTADRGQLIGLVGPNGAGKTTFLRTLRATLTTDAGEVAVAGRRLADLSARRTARLVASVPQSTGLSFDFSVEETVEMGRTPHVSRFGSLGADDRRAVETAMRRTEVMQFADRAITEVSGGERQRVLLARALAQSTPVLMLDEPTASLDINHAVRTLELVRSLVEDGKTAVAAIHDLDLAARYCDELVLLADGEVRASGPPSEVLTATTLRETFDATALVTDGVATGAPEVTPLPNSERADEQIHVVGTGAPAAEACARLAATGYEGSLGVVPDGDVAAETAADVGFETVTVPAFSGIDAGTRSDAARLADAADLIVVAGDVADGNRLLVAGNRTVAGANRSGTEGATPVVRLVEACESDDCRSDEIDAVESTLADLPAVIADGL